MLSEYDFDIIHRAGRLHGNADALSRMYNKNEHYVELTFEEFEKYKEDHVVPNTDNITIVQGDLFTAPETYSLAHCVSKDFEMGGGIAKRFKEQFGEVNRLRSQHKRVGEVACLTQTHRNIYYLVTKRYYYEKPLYKDVWNAISNLKQECEENQEESLAIPKIGCGLDNLQWDKILEMIKFIFYGSKTKVFIYVLSPGGACQVKTVEKEIILPIWDKELIRQAQDQDAYCGAIKAQLEEKDDDVDDKYYVDKEGVLYKLDIEDRRDKLVVPIVYVPKVLKDFHNSRLAGHQGQQRTLQLIKEKFYWPTMRKDVIQYCTKCDSCNQRKTSPHEKRAPLQRFTKTYAPWELTSMDIVGPLVTTYNGNRYLLTFQDYFTKYPEAIPIPDQKAETVAKAFVEHVIVRHGAPDKLLTDQGTNFVSKMFKEVCHLLGIKKVQTSSYAPTSNGQIERLHRALKDMLSHYIADDQRDWDTWVPFVLMAYRGAKHSTTGYSPFYLLHGREQILPIDNFIRSGRTRYDVDENYVTELLARLKRVYTQVHENTEKAKTSRITKFNKHAREKIFTIGDLVYLRDMAAKIGISKKLSKYWKGPYQIVDKIGPVTYRIKEVESRKEQVVHVNRLKKYYEVEEQVEEETESDDTDTNTEEETVEEAAEPNKVIPLFPQWLRPSVEISEHDDSNEEPEDTKETWKRTEEPGIPLRRSTRVKRPPERLNL